MHAFTPEAASALGGPFVDERVSAAERAINAPWPTAGEEIWRYSRIGELSLDRFEPGRLDTNISGGGGAVSVVTGHAGITPHDSAIANLSKL